MENELLEAAGTTTGRKEIAGIPDDWTERISPIKKQPRKLIHRDFSNQDFRFGFGNDVSTDDSSGDDDNLNWNTVTRTEKMEEKKKRQRDRKLQMQSDTATKARNMIGLGPIPLEAVRGAMRHSRDLERGKRIAFKDHLAAQYDFSDEELRTMIITETKMSGNGDEVIYAAFENHEDVREIYIRQAEYRNDDLTVRGYVPPQYYERYSTLNKMCKERRSTNPELKTQLRFGFKDVEVFTKIKGEGVPFKQVRIKDFAAGETVPEFNHKIKWRRQPDRLLHRPASRQEDRQSPVTKAAGPEQQPRLPNSAEPAGEKEKSLVRQRSTQSNKSDTKKLRRNTSQMDMESDTEFATPTGRNLSNNQF